MCPLVDYVLFFSFFVDKQLDPSPVHVGYVVGKVVLGQKFLRVLPFSLSVSLNQCSVLFYSPISDVIRSQQLTVSLNKTSLPSWISHFRFNIAHISFDSAWVREKYKNNYESSRDHLQVYRGSDKSSARPGRKQANVCVRMTWISFGALPCRKKMMTARVWILLKSRASLICFRVCFLAGQAKDLSAPR